ncbi:MAG: hypothetical protein ACI9FR_000434 [Cryomorphaceae bacterium]|jgi:hypothetical protein
MKRISYSTISLWGLILFGLITISKVSIENLTGIACPNLFSIPVCYVLTVAYLLMLCSVATNHHGFKHHFFAAGWGVAFVIALFASIAELVAGGGICPSTSSGGLRAGSNVSIPLCYLNLFLLLVILGLFIQDPYRKACEQANQQF